MFWFLGIVIGSAIGSVAAHTAMNPVARALVVGIVKELWEKLGDEKPTPDRLAEHPQQQTPQEEEIAA